MKKIDYMSLANEERTKAEKLKQVLDKTFDALYEERAEKNRYKRLWRDRNGT